jgi:hypothetical protein
MVAGVLGSGAIAHAQTNVDPQAAGEARSGPLVELRAGEDNEAKPATRTLQLPLDELPLDDGGQATGEVQLELVGDGDKPAAAPPAKPGETGQQKPGVVFGVAGAEGNASYRVADVGGYWIGLQLEPAGDALKSQLQLPSGSGLVVEAVLPEGPAAKAGFQQYDIVLKVEGQAATNIDAFNKQVADAKDAKALSVELLRHGKTETIKVKPQKRPETFSLSFSPTDGTANVIRDWLPKGVEMDPQGMLREPMRVEMFHPGVLFLRDDGGELPKNLSVSISRSGDEPAKITVKKENTTWDVTEKELDKLPADVRPHVERMLGKQAGDAGQRMKVFTRRVAPPGAHGELPQAIAVPGGASARDVLIERTATLSHETDKRLDEMNRKLEALQKSMDELTKRLPAAEGAK